MVIKVIVVVMVVVVDVLVIVVMLRIELGPHRCHTSPLCL